MSMSTHVIGIKPPDDKWKDMKAVWDACKKANVTPPEDVLDFFAHEPPDDLGVRVEIERQPCTSVFKPRGGSSQGFEVDLKKLPPDVTVIRFYNSY